MHIYPGPTSDSPRNRPALLGPGSITLVYFRPASLGVGGSWLKPRASWVAEPRARAAWWPSELCKVGGPGAGRAQGCRSSQPPLGDMTNGCADKPWSAFHLGAMHGFAFKAGKQTTGTRHNTCRPQMIQPFSPLKQGTCKGERKTALLEFFDEYRKLHWGLA